MGIFHRGPTLGSGYIQLSPDTDNWPRFLDEKSRDHWMGPILGGFWHNVYERIWHNGYDRNWQQMQLIVDFCTISEAKAALLMGLSRGINESRKPTTCILGEDEWRPLGCFVLWKFGIVFEPWLQGEWKTMVISLDQGYFYAVSILFFSNISSYAIF